MIDAIMMKGTDWRRARAVTRGAALTAATWCGQEGPVSTVSFRGIKFRISESLTQVAVRTYGAPGAKATAGPV